MKKNEVNIPKAPLVKVNDALCFLGSCFSEHIASYTSRIGFDVYSNPFGVVFNPISLAKQIESSEESWENSIFQVEDKFLSWNSSNLIWSLDRTDLKNKLCSLRANLHRHIEKASILFITFGTSWVYELKEKKRLVANNHKQPTNYFTKRCLETAEIIDCWEHTLKRLKEINPTLKIVFTISPVRHKKDGLVENNLSKSRLIDAVHEIVSQRADLFYFPSYELVIDELRDYAYFENDGVHPNKYAIEVIESRFFNCYITPKAQEVIQSFLSLKQLLSHRILHPGTKEAEMFEKSRELKIANFLLRHPEFSHLMK
jgi:hypothetical protein